MSPVEVYTPGQGSESEDNKRRRDAAFASLLRIAPAVTGDKMPASGILGPGTYKGGVYAVAVNVTGIGEAVVDGTVEFSATAIVRNVTFKRAITVKASASVLFAGCVFLAPITVEAGGVVGCGSCRFDGTASIVNAGDGGNANRVGCVGTSALAGDLNVTPFGGV